MSFDKFLTKVFGSSNQRFLKTIGPLVNEINSLEPSVQKLSDDELRARTAAFKEKVANIAVVVEDWADDETLEEMGIEPPDMNTIVLEMTLPVGSSAPLHVHDDLDDIVDSAFDALARQRGLNGRLAVAG